MTSKATKRKYVVKEVLEDFALPEANQQIVQVCKSCGSNLHEVSDAAGKYFLVSMPTKFRRNIWIKKNDYVLITSIKEGDKVKGEITAILYKEQIKYIKENKQWPAAFEDKSGDSKSQVPIDDDMLPPTYSDSEDEDEETGGISNPNTLISREDNSDSE